MTLVLSWQKHTNNHIQDLRARSGTSLMRLTLTTKHENIYSPPICFLTFLSRQKIHITAYHPHSHTKLETMPFKRIQRIYKYPKRPGQFTGGQALNIKQIVMSYYNFNFASQGEGNRNCSKYNFDTRFRQWPQWRDQDPAALLWQSMTWFRITLLIN